MGKGALERCPPHDATKTALQVGVNTASLSQHTPDGSVNFTQQFL